ncbi:AVT1, partial [Symbiodinium sp. CCMP2456]
VTLSPEINSFIEKMVNNCQLPEGEKVFDYWADTGVGSWIRLAGKRQSEGHYRRYSHGTTSTHSHHGSYSGAHATRPPAPQAEPCPPRSAQFQARALPGWVTRVQSADGVATPATRTMPPPASSTLPEEASLPPSSASTFLTEEVLPKAQPDRPPPPSSDHMPQNLSHVVTRAIPKRNKVANKMKHESTGAPESQVAAPAPAPTPKPPPAELRQVAPAPPPSIPAPAQEP